MTTEFPSALRSDMPEGLMEFIEKMMHKRNDQLFDATPSDLQMVIVVLRQGGQQPNGDHSGTAELRRPMAPLPKNPFQI